MRLLNVDTFQFEEFFYQTPPSYAILSHTWGDDSEEVSYSNVLAGRLDSLETRPAKVTGCCNQAREDGYQYVWIDTCCIDKTNSVELQEAINSMFKWYRKADICYVYLADVPPGDEIQNPDSRFHSSRWFQRGWTLQELLAPHNLRFYDTSWECLGSKGELCDTIEGITGIPKPYLLGIHELHHASIAQRMSWAASRVTKREEDIAYCLLGIFGIVMSMIYGEGLNAFRRLQEHIMLKDTTDDSILAWGLSTRTSSSSSSALANHPSQFALSGQIVSRPQPGTDSLDMRAGVVRLHLRILYDTNPDDPRLSETFGVLSCGPEHKPQMFVCLPLTRAPGDEDGEYTRISNRRALLENLEGENHKLVPCRIRVDGKPRQSTAPAQAHFFHIQRSASTRNLEIVDVQPPEWTWHKERSLIEASVPNGDGQHRAFLRLRDDNRDSSDFVIVLEAVASGPVLRAQCDVMTASKDTPLSDIQGVIDAIRLRSHQALHQSANNGALTLRAALASEAMQGTFSLRLEKLTDPPAQTTNATLELENIRRNMEIECLRKVAEAVEKGIRRLEEEAKYETTALDEVQMELLEVDKEMQRLLERKTRLEDDKASHTSMLNRVREVDSKMHLKMETLATWTGAAEEQLKSLVNNTPIDTEDRQVGDGHRILHLAAETGYDDLVLVLIENGAPIDEPSRSGWTPLYAAASKGHTETVRLLLDKGANVDTKNADAHDWTPLHSAVKGGHESTVRELLERGAKMTPASKGWMPLHTAAQWGSEPIARLLLDWGADMSAVSNKNSTPLHIATTVGNVDVVRLLLDRGVHVEMRGKENMTPLHMAAMYGNENVVKLLVQKGASLSAILSVSGSTALHLASQNGREGVVRVLLEGGADPTLVEKDGTTPLHSAAYKGLTGIMSLLIKHGAQVGAVCKDGSVLAVAAYFGHEDAVRLLISKGADVDQRAQVYADRPGSEDIARILRWGQAGVQKSPRQDRLEKTPAKGKIIPHRPPESATRPSYAGRPYAELKSRTVARNLTPKLFTDPVGSFYQDWRGHQDGRNRTQSELKLEYEMYQEPSSARNGEIVVSPAFASAEQAQRDRDMKASAERAEQAQRDRDTKAFAERAEQAQRDRDMKASAERARLIERMEVSSERRSGSRVETYGKDDGKPKAKEKQGYWGVLPERASRNPDKRGVSTEPAAPPRERVESGVVPGPRDRSKAKLAKEGWRGTLRDLGDFLYDPDLKQRGAQH